MIKENTKYNDKTGFHFDLSPVNRMTKQDGERGGMREPFYGASYVSYTEKGYSSWSNWMDKIQPDERFLAISDKNAHTYQFPEVETPWKFTDYNFKGVGTDVIVIEPQLYSPLDLELFNETPEIKMKGTEKTFYEPLYMYQNRGSHKKYKQEDLENGIDGYEPWFDPTYKAKDSKNQKLARSFKRLEMYSTRKVFKYPTANTDVRLNKVRFQVESLNMGAHGNIPPHTLNMYAPEEFFNPDNIYLTEVIIRTIATMGTPVTAQTDGIIDYSNTVLNGINRIYIYPVTQYTQTSTTSPFTWSITANMTRGVMQPKPAVDMQNVAKIHLVASSYSDDDLVHKGCAFFKGNKTECKCTIQTEKPDEVKPDPANCTFYPDNVTEETNIKEEYQTHAGENACPYYQHTGPQDIAMYESEANTQGELASMYAGMDNYNAAAGAQNYTHSRAALSMTGSSMGGGSLDYGMVAMGALNNLSAPLEEQRTMSDTEVRWKTIYELKKTPIKSREIKSRGFGDAQDTIVRGTGKFAFDTQDTGYGGVDRNFFNARNLMSIHRFNNNVMPCYRADKCNPMVGPSMSIGFTPGHFAGDTEEEYCRYYNMGCPYNTVPRRAYEYANNYQWLVTNFAKPFKIYGFAAFPELEIGTSNNNYYQMYGSKALKDTIYFGATPIENFPEEDKSLYFYVVCDDPSENSEYYKDAKIYAHIEHRDNDNNKIYMDGVSKPSGYPEDVPWLVEVHDDYVMPNGLIMQVDNEKQFWGGRAPEYKDLTLMGEEILCPIGAGGNIYGDTASGEDGGGTDNPRIQAEQDKGYFTGYYIDVDGEWIDDGRPLGETVETTNEVRATFPAKTRNNSTPISGAVKRTIISPGMTVSKTMGRAWVYSSDTRAILESQEMADLSNSEGHSCPPNQPPAGHLPKERTYYTCAHCNNFTITDKLQDETVEFVVTDVEYLSGTTKCPICDEELDGPHEWMHFPKVKARGTVTVWGLPGQIVKTNAYYWSHPTVINRAFVTYLLAKLGKPNAEGGGYDSRPESSDNKKIEENVSQYFVPDGNLLREGLQNDEGEVIDGTQLIYSHRDTSEETDDDKKIYKNALPLLDNKRLDGGKYRDDTVSPYDEDVDGVDMFTLNHIKSLRNKLMPIFAYTLDGAGSSDYHIRKQLGKKHRYQESSREYYGKPGIVPTQVIAANTLGRDQFLQIWDGTVIPCKAIRIYAPTSPIWWRLKNSIGGIQRHGGTNGLHFDNSKATIGSVMHWYTGDRLSSSAYFFLHGQIPLDKEVVKAYAIVYPRDEEPSMPPLGRVWDGRNLKFHYHAYTTDHESNTNHDSYSMYSDDNDVTMCLGESHTYDYFVPYLYDMNSVFYQNTDDNISQYFASYRSGTSKEYITWDGYGKDIVQHFTEEEIWKNYTFEEFEERVKRDKTEIVFTCGDMHNGGIASEFTMYSNRLLDNVFNNECQSIPGYFDFSGLNNTKYYPRSGPVIAKKETNTLWAGGGQVIMQSDDPVNEDGKDWGSGGHGNANGGHVPRMFDITDVIKKKYNARIDRAYKLSTGNTFESLHKINIDRHLKSAYDKSQYPPEESFNYRYTNSYGLWLSDGWHYPKLENDETPIKPHGEKIEVAPSGRIVNDLVTGFYVRDDLSEGDDGYYDYHPIVLCGVSVDVPTETNGAKPDTDRKYWMVQTDIKKEQSFVTDTRNIPIMTSHKPYRAESGHWDVSNAVCPNPNCYIGSQGMSVSSAVNWVKTHPGNVSPSLTGIKCAWCGTSLIEPGLGAVYIGGDGIETYNYTSDMQKDSFIRAFKISQNYKVEGVDRTKDFATSFSIDFKRSDDDNWEELFSVYWNNETEKWEYGIYYQASEDKNITLVTVESEHLPEYFVGEWIDGRTINQDNIPASLVGKHFLIPKARYLRYRAQPRKMSSFTQIAGEMLSSSIYTQENKLLSDEPIFITDKWQNGTIEFADDFLTDEIISYDLVSNTDKEAVSNSTLNHGTYTKFRLSKKFYVCICTKFEVYGYEIADNDVTMTPPAKSDKYPLTKGYDRITMYDFPTKIMSVKAGCFDTSSINLVELEYFEDKEFYWTIEEHEDIFSKEKYYKITQGKYFFSPETKTIMIPTLCREFLAGEDKYYNLWELNSWQDPKDIPSETVPSFIEVKYFTGIGVPIDLTATAIGDGPSYQVEKEAICNISQYEPEDNAKISKLIPKSTGNLPDMGYSVKLKSSNEKTDKEKLFWQVYNHQPFIGNFNMGYIRGDEMPAGGWNESDIEKLFGGQEQTEVGLEGGSTTYISGNVSGNVTLYGIPDAIISGDFYVYAKALTERSYVVGNELVKTYERTGGLKYTGFSTGIFIKDDESVEQSRKSVAFKVPIIKIYLRERDNTKKPQMQ